MCSPPVNGHNEFLNNGFERGGETVGLRIIFILYIFICCLCQGGEGLCMFVVCGRMGLEDVSVGGCAYVRCGCMGCGFVLGTYTASSLGTIGELHLKHNASIIGLI